MTSTPNNLIYEFEVVPSDRPANQPTTTHLNTSTSNRRIRQPRRCGICGATGHDRRNYPNAANSSSENQNAFQIQSRNATNNRPSTSIPPPRHVQQCSCVVFDTDTTGFSPQRHEIIQLAAQIFDQNGEELEGAVSINW